MPCSHILYQDCLQNKANIRSLTTILPQIVKLTSLNIQLVGVSPIVNLFSGQNSPGNISASTSINNIGNILQFPKWESVANFSHYWELPGTMFFSLVKVFIWYQFGVTFPNVGFTSGNEGRSFLGYKCRQ